MDVYKLKLTKLQNSIFQLLCKKAGSSLNQREIAQLLRVSPTAVAKALKTMKPLVKIQINRTLNSVQLNRDEVISLKRIENLKQILPLTNFLKDKFPGTTIVLFGSYSRGEDTVDSDIDLAIIGSKEKPLDLTKFEKELERPIRINYFQDLKINKNLKANIMNGITLHGFIEIV